MRRKNIISEIKKEVTGLVVIVREMDRKVIIIFLSVAVLQTISWYFTSRNFFRINFFPSLQNDPAVYLYEYLYWFLGDFITLFILSTLIIKFIFKENLNDYGLKFGDYKIGLILSLIFFIIMLPFVWFFSATPDFVVKYPHLLSARTNWDEFIIYESALLVYMFGWEFIWRGFMLFGLEKKFGYYSVLIQMIPFVILHNGKPIPETFGAIAGGIALGILAFRTRSIYYCVITHMGVMLSIDLISTLRYRANDYGVGVESVLKIIKAFF
ncbi:MAG: CPBP family intramembrane metalloprotease [Ignavibacteriaceae bacterium]|jgi:membrane protease YdiL (CAAX protease family)|nr:CPBP family intramembrane metalloprotease [Chlorobium sp.]MCW8816614.1 CPBP family intramembrane metalloprotease [Ignavibacteriaceae bacterium]MCW8823519.1 CPBP family intramembrane metalloprotease [Ignavibacteriaceae bacterium]MCW9095618.1 CPBP family intramembrane metalloprotease [Ignavibacteriaceae bacterium]MCW9097724.1 CPBP family intramembrane metalloprotease [Ignavibacteriaceae bacterium]